MKGKEKKRILMLNYEFPPLGGGAGNATSYLLKEFVKKKDIQIDLVTSSIGKYRKEKFSDNVNIYFLDIGKKGNLHNQGIKDLLCYSLKSYQFSKKLLKQNQYDLTHAFFSIPSGFVAMLLGIPFVVSLRGSDVPFYSEKYKWLDVFIFQWLNKIIWLKAQTVVANSSDLRDLALKTYSKKEIKVIPNGVNLKEFKPILKNPLNPPLKNGEINKKGTYNILSTSRLTERKGIIYLLEAVKNLVPVYPQIRLNLVGGGDQIEEFKKFVKENNLKQNVVFKGIINHDRIIKEYQNSDIFVLPSFNEGMSNSLLEALASGLVLISTDTGGAKDLIDKSNGSIVGTGSAKEIEKALENLLKNKNRLQSMQKSSRKKALSFNWKKVGREYLDLYGKN